MRSGVRTATRSHNVFRPQGLKRHAPDFYLLLFTGSLLFFGLIMLWSATSVMSFAQSQTSSFYLKQQLLHGILPGIVLFFVMYKIDYTLLRKFTPFLFFATLVLLMLVFVPSLSFTRNDVRSWITIGGFTLQPSELAKLTFLLWLSGWLVKRESTISSLRKTSVVFFAMLGMISILLMLQPDLGTMLTYVMLGLTLFILAGGNLAHASVAAALGVAALLPKILTADYRLRRLLTFWNPNQDLQGAGYQIHQALIALGAGSWLGVGIGKSQQKFQFLPEIESDSIFAIIGEELGFVVTSAVVLFFICIFFRGISIARNAPDQHGYLLACGVSFL
ncbi:MAG: FtsW/RodA/SpoVE family cell cycle protein, partial [Patescibacteria group bacterium]